MFNLQFKLLMKELEFNKVKLIEELYNLLLDQHKLKITIELETYRYLQQRFTDKMLFSLF